MRNGRLPTIERRLFLGKRTDVAKQAGALARGHHGAAARRIAGRAGQRSGDGVADDRIGAEFLAVNFAASRKAGPERQQRAEQGRIQPNTSAVMVRNQLSA